jgi:hypothetical protein
VYRSMSAASCLLKGGADFIWAINELVVTAQHFAVTGTEPDVQQQPWICELLSLRPTSQVKFIRECSPRPSLPKIN